MVAPSRTCATCAYYLSAPDAAKAAGVNANIGECRALPPVTNYRWPRVQEGEWCGRWSTKEQVTAREEKKPKALRTAAQPLQVLGTTSTLPLSAPESTHANATP